MNLCNLRIINPFFETFKLSLFLSKKFPSIKYGILSAKIRLLNFFSLNCSIIFLSFLNLYTFSKTLDEKPCANVKKNQIINAHKDVKKDSIIANSKIFNLKFCIKKLKNKTDVMREITKENNLSFIIFIITTDNEKLKIIPISRVVEISK